MRTWLLLISLFIPLNLFADPTDFFNQPPQQGNETPQQLNNSGNQQPGNNQDQSNTPPTNTIPQTRYTDPGEPYRRSALDAINTGDYTQARRIVDDGLKTAPNDQNLQDLQKLLTKHVDGADPMKAVKSILNGEQKPTADELAAKDAQSLSPNGPRYASPLAWVSPQGAARAAPYEPSLRFIPNSKNPNEGVLKLQMGEPAAAARFFTKKIEEDPTNWLAYRFRALAKRNLNDLPGAYEDASQAIRLNPKDGWSHDVRSLVLIDLGRYKEAVSDSDRAIAINARDASAWRTRALAWEKLEKPDNMLADLKRAAELDPQFEALYRQALDSHRRRRAPMTLPLRNYGLWLLALLAFSCAIILRLMRGGVLTSPFSQRMDLVHPPPQIEGFQILRKLGQGGMGEVYEAMDQVLKRKVAIKRMLEEIAQDPRERKRFIREAQTVASLSHPNIVQIHTVLARPDGVYLIFELVQGQPLSQLLEERGALSLWEGWEFLRHIGAALDYAHSQGVLHRDLKPSNVMIAGKLAKVMDFGIARHVQKTLSTSSRGEVVGTPAYMAPEQEVGHGGKESDLYALACCFYEMLAGTSPFPGPIPYLMKLQKAYRPLSEAALSLPKEIDSVMAKALDPDPEKRFHSAQEFISTLQGSLSR